MKHEIVKVETRELAILAARGDAPPSTVRREAIGFHGGGAALALTHVYWSATCSRSGSARPGLFVLGSLLQPP